MFSPSRRAFLGSATALGLAPDLFGAAPTESAPFQPGTLFLTWHCDPTTTMVVQWVGIKGETADTKVYYRPVAPLWSALAVGGFGARAGFDWQGEMTQARPYPLGEMKVFRCELTGLRPDTEYQFRIGRESPLYKFRTMPAKATDAISFVSGGDCGANSHTVANNIQAAKQDPSFAVIGGDLAYENGRSALVHLAFLKAYSQHMVAKDGRLIPMVACLGNHEVDGGYGKKREKAPFFYSLFDGLFPETGYNTLDFGDYLSLVLLDTGHTSDIKGEQTLWLEEKLKARRDHPNVMVVNHVPAYPSARSMGKDGKGGTGEDNREYWVPLFEKHRVPVVLEHHDHTFKRTRPLIDGTPDADGVIYLGDGSWGKIRPQQPPEKLRHMAAVSSAYHMSLHRIEGEERFHMALNEDGKIMDVARTAQRSAGLVRTDGG